MPLPRFSRTPINAALFAAALAMSHGHALATPFYLTTNTNLAQTLGAASGETGTVAAGAALTLGGSTVAVAITGNDATLNNLGTIAQTGSGRAIRDNRGVTNLVINNGSATNAAALIRTADADVIQMNVPASSVTLNNYGTLVSLNASAGGAQAVDFSVMTGANALNNYAGGVIRAYEADAVRPGANGTVFNAGIIESLTGTGSNSDAIDGQGNSGLRIANAATGLIDGGRHGITAEQASAGSAFTLNVTNEAGGIIRGNNGAGINIDGFDGKQVVTVVNHGTILGNGIAGDGDGIDVDGLVDIVNTGTIRSLNAFSAPAAGLAYSEGITAGGGRIVNSGTIEGLVAAGNGNAVGRGITLAGNDIASGPLAGTREGLYGNAVIINQAGGIIRGQSDSAIVATGAASGYTVTVDNRAGATIVGGGTANAAIRGGADRTFITNAGTIDGSSSGKAIGLGGANDTVLISGGSATVIGSIDGGAGTNTMVVDAGAGNAFSYAGSIGNFASVEFRSGHATLSGQSTYDGATIVSGGTLSLVGADRIAAGSALVLAGGVLDVTQAGTQTFASLALTGSSSIMLGDASLTFNGLAAIAPGATLALTDDVGGPAYAFRFLGDYANDADFLALMQLTTIDRTAVTYSFDGMYTNVTAVPEPTGFAMLVGGLGILAALTRRRRGGA